MTTLEKMRYDATSLNEVEGRDKRVCAPNYGWDWKMEAINISKIIETKQCLQNTIHQHKHFVVESLGFITNFTHARTCKFWCSFFVDFVMWSVNLILQAQPLQKLYHSKGAVQCRWFGSCGVLCHKFRSIRWFIKRLSQGNLLVLPLQRIVLNNFQFDV